MIFQEKPEHSDPCFWSKTSFIQLGYGVWVNLTVIGIGLAFGFSAVALPQLATPESTFHASLDDESWIASVINLSSPIGCLLCGYITDKFGRRIGLLSSSVPMSAGWLYTALAKSDTQLIIGRVITGVGCGMAMGPPRVYTTEISLPNMRGVIGSFPNLAMSIGITIQAGLGSILDWHVLCYICALYTFITWFSNFFLPETPHYVLMKHTAEKAKTSLKKFRSAKHNIDYEMEELIEYKTVNNIRRLSTREVLKALFRPSSCKPFWILMTYIVITQVSGVSIIIFWTVQMIESSRSSVDAHLGNLLLGVTRFFSGILVSVLLYRVGRRPLALTSGLGVGLSCIFLGIYIDYTDETNIIPQICYMLYIIFATLGYYSIPFLLMSELYPLQIRGILGGISVSVTSLLIFGANKFYPKVKTALGFPNTIFAFGICSLIGSIFLYFFLPETNGLTLQEIEEYFNNLRPTLVSQRQVMSVQLSRQSANKTISANMSKPSRSVIQGRQEMNKNQQNIPNDRNKEDADNTRTSGTGEPSNKEERKNENGEEDSNNRKK